MASSKIGASVQDPRDFAALLRVNQDFHLTELSSRGTPGRVDRPSAKEQAAAAKELTQAQERLFAQGRVGGTAAVLLVLQGMDTSGKGGITRHVISLVDPQGVRLTAFKAPTASERAHSFLWRIRRALPDPGYLGVFDRSHYEDVLIVRVHNLVPQAQWAARYDKINDFEQKVADSGTVIVKVLLQISREEQYQRLAQRLDRPDKYWKYNPGDVTEREFWDDYQEAYQAALENCNTPWAPWHVVPADRKWYARWAVTQLLRAALNELDPQWPAANFDLAAERTRLAATQASPTTPESGGPPAASLEVPLVAPNRQ